MLSDDIPVVFLTNEKLEFMRKAISEDRMELTFRVSWNVISKRAEHAMQIDTSKSVAYTGTVAEEFLKKAQTTMNPMLYLSICGLVTNNQEYMTQASRILLDWATAKPTPGTELHNESNAKRLSATGLTLSRFMDRVVETYRILALSTLSDSDRAQVLDWVHKMGKTIQASHEFWLLHHEVEGPQNHMSWHVFGMTLSGLVTGDHDLLRYALIDTANKWNFVHIVDSAIYRTESTHCMFRSGCNKNGESFSFGCATEHGEMFDRYRTLSAADEGKAQPCGLHYCLFNLRALMYTAHVLDSNPSMLSSSPMIRHEILIPGSEEGENSFQLPLSPTCCICNNALLAALRYYGQYYIFFSFPTSETHLSAHTKKDSSSRVKCIEYAPYRNQVPDFDNIPSFLLGAHHFPHDDMLQEVLRSNIPSETLSLTMKHPLFNPHPLTTPVCYLVLLFSCDE